MAEHDTWINTRLPGTIRTLLLTGATLTAMAGEHLDAQLSDGELVIKGVRVTAGDQPDTLANRLQEYWDEITLVARTIFR